MPTRILHSTKNLRVRRETFKLSTAPLFMDKMRDIVGLYMDPPHMPMVLCVDEKR